MFLTENLQFRNKVWYHSFHAQRIGKNSSPLLLSSQFFIYGYHLQRFHETFVPLIDSCFSHSRFTISHCSDFKVVFRGNIVSLSECKQVFVQMRNVRESNPQRNKNCGAMATIVFEHCWTLKQFLYKARRSNVLVTIWELGSQEEAGVTWVQPPHTVDFYWKDCFLQNEFCTVFLSGIRCRWSVAIIEENDDLNSIKNMTPVPPCARWVFILTSFLRYRRDWSQKFDKLHDIARNDNLTLSRTFTLAPNELRIVQIRENL